MRIKRKVSISCLGGRLGICLLLAFVPQWGRKINCVMRRFFPSSSVGDRPAPRGCTSTPDERKVTTI